jgi:uncharacterized phage-associated protein
VDDKTNPETSVDELSLIRQSDCNQAATVSAPPAQDGEAPMTATAVSAIWHETQPDDGQRAHKNGQYPPAMSVSVNDLAIRLIDKLWLDRKTATRSDKLHKLLYYAQGHHAAVMGEPLFPQEILAGDNGPVVEGFDGVDWDAPVGDLENGPLNSVGYVVSRYGRLSILDLQHLTMAESPWRNACQTRERRIELADMIAYFRGAGAPFDSFECAQFDRAAMMKRVAEQAAGARDRLARVGPAGPDETPLLRAKLEEAQARLRD